MSEQEVMFLAVYEDLNTAMILADWLQDHGHERKAVLLRRRCGIWWKDRTGTISMYDRRKGQAGAERERKADTSFRWYVFTIEAELMFPGQDDAFESLRRIRLPVPLKLHASGQPVPANLRASV
jgi:uncharacterized protein (TIGR02996 family)